MYNLNISFKYKDLWNLENFLNICMEEISKKFWQKIWKIKDFNLKKIISLAFREEFNIENPWFNTALWWLNYESEIFLINLNFQKNFFHINFYIFWWNLEKIWFNYEDSDYLENIFEEIAKNIFEKIKYEAFVCVYEDQIDPYYGFRTEPNLIEKNEINFITFAYIKNISWKIEFVKWKNNVEWIERKQKKFLDFLKKS